MRLQRKQGIYLHSCKQNQMVRRGMTNIVNFEASHTLQDTLKILFKLCKLNTHARISRKSKNRKTHPRRN